MRQERDRQAEIEAAQDRLKRFVKKASECTNYHDPERLRRMREGRENEPRGISWTKLARELHGRR